MVERASRGSAWKLVGEFCRPRADAIGVAEVAGVLLRHGGSGEAFGIGGQAATEGQVSFGPDELGERSDLGRRGNVAPLGRVIEWAAGKEPDRYAPQLRDMAA